MEIITDIASMMFFLWATIWSMLFYTGKLKYTGERERIRKERVTKYKWLMIVSITGLAVGCLGMLMVIATKLLKG
jgi:hypothetical protein